jgi:hypothetical protein
MAAIEKPREGRMRVGLNPDKQGVIFVFGDMSEGVTYNAEQLSSLLDRLAIFRSEMSPPTDMRTPPAQVSLAVHMDHWAFGQEVRGFDDDHVLLVLPHPGYGWIPYRFPMADAKRLANELAAKIQDKSPGLAH